ncbi:MAG: SMI1/KNR4 family protein [Proteobacteria bacterium]|nr:SMI1/KNR4 family protein [Pseudomonadota bacterium]
MDDFFTDDELAQLRAHGIVLFAGRVIFDAQPPISAQQLAAVEAACIGPVPPGLLSLWSQACGGALDYDLTARMNGGEEPIHWAELFGHGPAGFHDLPGWIAHERQAGAATDTQGTEWAPKLAALPFGGFDDTDRLHVVTEPGAQFGHVLAWKRSLPEGWPHAMHEDGLATLATNLEGAFAAMHLEEDPLEPIGDYFTGQALLDYLDERHGDHGLDLDLADKVVAYYRRALVDWRTPLREGRLSEVPPLAAQIAQRHAIATDDAALINELAAAGVRFDTPLLGSALPADLALAHGAFDAATALLEGDAPLSADALDSVEGAISPELAQELLRRGAKPTARAIAQCVAAGAPAAARAIAQAYEKAHGDLPQAFDEARGALLEQLQAALAEASSAGLGADAGAEGLAERIDHLQSFKL